MVDLSALLSRRSLFRAAWIFLLASVLFPAPAGSFQRGAGGVSGLYVLGKAIVWSRAQPGSSEALDFWHVAILTLALFSNIAFLFTSILRNHTRVSMACRIFLIAAVGINGSVAFFFPEFARLPAYWLWLVSFAVLAWVFLAFPGSGAPRRSASAKRAPASDTDAVAGGVPQLVWVWLGFTVFWLTVTGMSQSRPAATATVETRTDVPPATALVSYFNDQVHLIAPDMAAQLNAALARFEKETSNQIAVAIYARAPQGSIEEFTIETADRSRLGRKGLDNGAILFVFMNERSARLEVGYGLEGALTDVDAHRILEERLVPAFVQGDYTEGLDTALGAIFATVQDAYKQDRMPSKLSVLWRQVKVGVPKLAQQAWPTLTRLDLQARVGIAFFGGLLGLGVWDGFRQTGRLLDNLGRVVINLVARRPVNTEMESVGLDSILDTLKLLGLALAAIAGAAGVVVVAARGAFGGAGTLVRW